MRWTSLVIAFLAITPARADFIPIPLGYAGGASADGSAVVGYDSFSSGFPVHGFRWTAANGKTAIGNLPGYSSDFAFGISGDGNIVVGRSTDQNGAGLAYRWTQATGPVSLGNLPGYSYSQANRTSNDGSVVVGMAYNGPTTQAFRWTSSTGLVGLGGPFSEATGVSADGTVIAGTIAQQAFRWTAEKGIVGLGFLPGNTSSYAYGLSADGSTVVGYSSGLPTAFRWTEQAGMVALDPTDTNSTYAFAASGDGSEIVGRTNIKGLDESIIWDATHGIRLLKDVLRAQGDDLGFWILNDARWISPDGLTIVGYATNINTGVTEGFEARLTPAAVPEPSSLVLVGLGGFGFFLRWARYRMRRVASGGSLDQ